MERKQLALDVEIRVLLEVRGQDALAPDIGGSRRDSGQIASVVDGRLCRVLRLEIRLSSSTIARFRLAVYSFQKHGFVPLSGAFHRTVTLATVEST